MRRRKPNEDPNKTRLRRDLTPYKCSRCWATSHNTRRCTLPPLVVPEEENEVPRGAAEGVVEGAVAGV